MTKQWKGFASMDPAKVRAIASKGGKTKTSKPKGFAALSPEARKAVSIKGGKASQRD